MLARDSAVLADMVTQAARLQALPESATRLAVSCGGNDVLGLVGAMQTPVHSVLDAAGRRGIP